MAVTVGEGVRQAIGALDALGQLGEQIEDEWQYVVDLHGSWRERLAGIAEARGDEALRPPAGEAIDAATNEASRITDPHRAIDWLSTFPQLALAALGESD